MSKTSTDANPIDIAEKLIACPSVTPATGEVFAVLEAMLKPLGFTVDRFLAGEAPDGPVENLLAWRTTGPGRHFAFAEHLDRSEEHTSELKSLMRNSYAVFCLKKKTIR